MDFLRKNSTLNFEGFFCEFLIWSNRCQCVHIFPILVDVRQGIYQNYFKNQHFPPDQKIYQQCALVKEVTHVPFLKKMREKLLQPFCDPYCGCTLSLKFLCSHPILCHPVIKIGIPDPIKVFILQFHYYSSRLFLLKNFLSVQPTN